MKSKKYMTKPKIIRLKMLQADYPNIYDKKTRNSLAVNGETSVSRVLHVSGLPRSLRDFEERMFDELTNLQLRKE